MYCVKCGVELADSQRVCPLCGTRVFHPDIPRTPADPPYPPDERVHPEEVNRSGVCFILTALALTLGLSVSAAAAGPASTAPDDLDSYLLAHTTVSDGARSLPIDRSEVNEHAITGYYTYTFQDGDAAGRTFKLYAGRHAALRAYITVIAVPDGTGDTYEFLEEQGWLEQADTYGELLFVLEPAYGSW